MPRPLTRTQLSSPIGDIDLVLKGETILICEFSDRRERTERQLAKFYQGESLVAGTIPEVIMSAFSAYFSGETDALSAVKAAPEGTPFQQRVWNDLRTIPAGTAQSYGTMAERLKSSPRAVGNANGANPTCLVLPCHRVIGANGALTGYAGGLERKEWLLRHEGVLESLRLFAQ